MEDLEARLETLQLKLEQLEQRLQRLEQALYSNPGGVLWRLAKLEERVRHLESLVKLAVTLTAGALLATLAQIASTLTG